MATQELSFPHLTLTHPTPAMPCSTANVVPISAARTHTGAQTQPITRRRVPALETIVESIATSLLEVLYGLRSPSSLRRWISPAVERRIKHYFALRSTYGRPAIDDYYPLRTGRPRVCVINTTSVEACITIYQPRNVRAFALRIERNKKRWVVTDFQTT